MSQYRGANPKIGGGLSSGTHYSARPGAWVPVLALLIMSMSSAHAAEANPSAPETFIIDDAFDDRWSGFYIGASIGGGWGESTTFYNRNGNDHLTRESIDPSGYVGAFTLGYNYQFVNRFVVGIEADLGVMDISAPDKTGLWDDHIWKSQYGGLWGTLRPRLGYSFGDLMVFGTGGLAFMETNEMILGDNDATQNTYNRGFHTGSVIGGGFEYAFSENTSAKVEYLRLDFPEYRGYTNNEELYGFENSVDLFRVGVNYKF